MKKTIISFMLGLALVVPSGVTTAQSPSETTPAMPTICYTFFRHLRRGSVGEDVRQLQKLLNQSADTQVSASGAGSLGNETTYFGPATYKAVIKFQEKHSFDVLAPAGLIRGTGFVGKLTVSKLNKLCGEPGNTSVPVITNIAPVSGPVGTKVRIYGTNLTNVKAVEFGSGYISIPSSAGSQANASMPMPYIEFTVPEYIGACNSTAMVCIQIAKQVTPGVYDIAVTNSKGTSNKVQFTVTGETVTSINIISPMAGEVWARGTQKMVLWNTPQVTYIQAPRYDIFLSHELPECAQPRPGQPVCLIAAVQYTLRSNYMGSAGLNNFIWIVGNPEQPIAPNAGAVAPIPNGRYQVKVCESGGSNCASSGLFTIE